MDLARLSSRHSLASTAVLTRIEVMRTYLFAAVVAALSTDVAAQDDNAITDMISNLSCAFPQGTSHHSCILQRHRSDPCGCSMAAQSGHPPGSAREVLVAKREALNMKNKNLYAGVAAGFVSGKVVKSFAYSLVPVAAIEAAMVILPSEILMTRRESDRHDRGARQFVEAEERGVRGRS